MNKNALKQMEYIIYNLRDEQRFLLKSVVKNIIRSRRRHRNTNVSLFHIIDPCVTLVYYLANIFYSR